MSETADSLPIRLYRKARKLGVWDPDDLDFSEDRRHWQSLGDQEREVILHLTSLFEAGEMGVTVDLLPLVLVIAREGRLEEELFLTTFLFEEGKHTYFFRRFLGEVCEVNGDLGRFSTPSFRRIFEQELPEAMNALLADSSPAAQVRAAVTYNLIVEGVLAETGYHAYHKALARNDLLPGLRRGIGYLKRDESRHIAYGVFLLSRLLEEAPELWPLAERRMDDLLEPALGIVTETFALFEPMPFGLRLEEFTEYALLQFGKRVEHIRLAAAR